MNGKSKRKSGSGRRSRYLRRFVSWLNTLFEPPQRPMSDTGIGIKTGHRRIDIFFITKKLWAVFFVSSVQLAAKLFQIVSQNSYEGYLNASRRLSLVQNSLPHREGQHMEVKMNEHVLINQKIFLLFFHFGEPVLFLRKYRVRFWPGCGIANLPFRYSRIPLVI